MSNGEEGRAQGSGAPTDSSDLSDGVPVFRPLVAVIEAIQFRHLVGIDHRPPSPGLLPPLADQILSRPLRPCRCRYCDPDADASGSSDAHDDAPDNPASHPGPAEPPSDRRPPACRRSATSHPRAAPFGPDPANRCPVTEPRPRGARQVLQGMVKILPDIRWCPALVVRMPNRFEIGLRSPAKHRK
jgi:hypothetical protein